MPRFLLLLSVAMAMTAPRYAGAQTPEEREAFRLYKEAQSDIEASRHHDAIEKLDRAYRMFRMPHILVRKAEALHGLGHIEKALELLRSVETTDPKLRVRMADLLVKWTREMQEPVTVEIQTNVPDVEVIVDHVEKYLAPCSIRVPRGLHHFEFRKNGYAPVVLEQEVAGPDTRAIRVALREVTGRVVFTTDLPTFEGVILRVDERELVPRGQAGAPNRTEALEIRAGSHRLLCAREGSPPFMRQFEVPVDRTVEVSCQLKPTSSGPSARTWAWVTLGTGAAMTAAGVGLVTWYYVKRGQNPGMDAAGNRYVFRNRHENVVGFVLLGVGVATAGASYFLFTANSASAKPEPVGKPGRFLFSLAPTPSGVSAIGAISF